MIALTGTLHACKKVAGSILLCIRHYPVDCVFMLLFGSIALASCAFIVWTVLSLIGIVPCLP